MKKTLYTGLLAMLFLAPAVLVFAEDADPASPQPFSVFCDPTPTPFTEGGYFVPTEGGSCTYTYPSVGSSTVVFSVFKGTPGSAVLIKHDALGPLVSTNFNNTTGPFVFSNSPYFFGAPSVPQVGDDFFSVVYGVDTLSQFFAAENYFTGAGDSAIPDSLHIVPWKWGIPLTITANSASVQYGTPVPTPSYEISAASGSVASA